MQLDKRKIESSLESKGFRRIDSSHHYYFHLIVEGKDAGIYTYTSHGPNPKAYADSLLTKMKKQLKLDTLNQLKDLVQCPMTGDDYIRVLKEKQIIPG